MKAVIFDMDGLMFDTERLYMQANAKVAEELGLGPVEFMTCRTLGLTSDRVRKEWEREFQEKGLRLLERREIYIREYYEQNHVPVKDGLKELLLYLKEAGLKTAVASSTGESKVRYLLRDAGIEAYFDVIVCGDMVKRSKPDPQIYLCAADMLDVRAGECFALEDSRNGICSAYTAGCRVIMVPDLWQPDDRAKKMAEKICEDLNEVKEYIRRSVR